MVVVLNEDGDRLSWCRIDNTPAILAAEIVAAGGPEAEVAMEATLGWYWAADVIAECGAGCIWRIRWGSPACQPAGEERHP